MFYPKLITYIASLKPMAEAISTERKKQLHIISDFISERRAERETAPLIYICTHNSRRSHFGQIWGQTLAAYFNYGHVKAYSGGTEATAFNPNAIKAVIDAGFKVDKKSEGTTDKNPISEVYYTDTVCIPAFSKRYNDKVNPQSGFCAIMTCTDADENCPLVEGAALRVATPYEDPKKFDGSPQQDAKYTERCRQIASEIYYMYTQVDKKVF